MRVFDASTRALVECVLRADVLALVAALCAVVFVVGATCGAASVSIGQQWRRRRRRSSEPTSTSSSLSSLSSSLSSSSSSLSLSSPSSPSSSPASSSPLSALDDPDANERAAGFVAYDAWPRFDVDEQRARAHAFLAHASKRRSVRSFARDRDVDDNVLRACIAAAGSAPSGAHTEPWTYAVVRSTVAKRALRDIVEAEERVNYERRMGRAWLDDLRPIGTTWHKAYLTDAPAVVVALRQTHGEFADGTRRTHHYSELSLPLSAGFLLCALHHAGLYTVTTTPMNAGAKITALLGRPANEKVVLLFPVGFPADDCRVPNFTRKSVDEYMAVY